MILYPVSTTPRDGAGLSFQLIVLLTAERGRERERDKARVSHGRIDTYVVGCEADDMVVVVVSSSLQPLNQR